MTVVGPPCLPPYPLPGNGLTGYIDLTGSFLAFSYCFYLLVAGSLKIGRAWGVLITIALEYSIGSYCLYFLDKHKTTPFLDNLGSNKANVFPSDYPTNI